MEYFDDDYLYAVQDPFTGEVGYCCIMGALGEYHSLGIYRGVDGLSCYQRIQKGEFENSEWEVLLYNNSLIVEFCNLLEELDEEDLEILRKLKFKKSGFNSIP